MRSTSPRKDGDRLPAAEHARRDAPRRPLRIFFSAGEPSGDLHAANLICQLRRRCGSLEAMGYGGPSMAEAGCQLHQDLTLLAVMWFARALMNVPKFWDLLSRADRYFRHHRPDAVVLVDYPAFNWWIARRAKAHGIPVFYYVPPQIWAWGQWRAKKMRRFVDHVLCALPFEQTWFQQHGCRAVLVGHPFFDDVASQTLDAEFMARMQSAPGPLVTILPGSRTQEVTGNLRWLLKAARQIHAAVPEARFAVAAFRPHQADYARQAVTGLDLPIEVHCGKTPELIRLAECCMAVSGSVSLELLYHCKPTVILYWVSRLAHFVQSWFRKVRYITLVNLLAADELFPADLTPYDPSQPDAARVLFPEYLTWEDRSGQIAAHCIQWLRHPDKRAAAAESLARLKAAVAHGGASQRAAEYIVGQLGPRPSTPGPHFAAETPAPTSHEVSR